MQAAAWLGTSNRVTPSSLKCTAMALTQHEPLLPDGRRPANAERVTTAKFAEAGRGYRCGCESSRSALPGAIRNLPLCLVSSVMRTVHSNVFRAFDLMAKVVQCHTNFPPQLCLQSLVP